MKPNIVYILADDMGYGDLSCLNENSKIRTENLDRLAADGLSFTDAHSSSAVCTPSRYSILTGRYNWRSGLKSGVLTGYDSELLEPGRMTVPSLLGTQGYRTACIGKWHLGWNWALLNSDQAGTQFDPEAEWGCRPLHQLDYSRPISGGPTEHGFDYFYGIAGSLDMPPYVYVENDRPTAVPDHITRGVGKRFWREGPTAPDFRHEDVLPRFTRKACEYIREQADQPFFLYFPLPSPHTPILPTERFAGKSGTNAYGDFCLLTDWCVGEVMRTLEECGIADNTILVFTSDNGCSPMADFKELAAAGHNPSYHFRGHKADIYEGGHRIPLIVRWPDRIRPGTTTDDVVCLADLLATCADIAGQSLPDEAGEDSVSSLPLWLGEELERPIREATVHHSIDGSFSIRQGRWKLEMCPGSGGWSYPQPGEECEGLPPIQLYDLNGDVAERTNVHDQYPDVVDRLTELLTAYVKNGRSTPGAPQPNTGGQYWPQLNWLAKDGLRA
jgi:arylsulfatase A-like enzyme